MGDTTIIALIEPRGGTGRLSIAEEMCSLIDEVFGREPILLDMDPQCLLSLRLLGSGEDLEICAQAQETTGIWMRDFLRGRPPRVPRLLHLTRRGQLFVPGWTRSETALLNIQHFVASHGFAPNPVEYLAEWFESLSQEVAVAVLPAGETPLTWLGVAAADHTIAFVHNDELQASDIARVRRRFDAVRQHATSMANIDTLRFISRAPQDVAGHVGHGDHPTLLSRDADERAGMLLDLLLPLL